MSSSQRRALVTGATGFIGARLAAALADGGWTVRCLVRDRSRAQNLERRGFEVHEGDVLRADSLDRAGDGVEVAYYLIHAMGRGTRGDLSAREHAGAENFARMALREGVERVIYLGGLGEPHSRHLRSRHETARVLAEHGPPLTYFRAGMVVGAGSESYRTLRHLVERLPAMIAPAWLKVPTQPIGIDDVLAYLTAAPDLPGTAGREIQIAGPSVLPYGEMLDRMARARPATAAEASSPAAHSEALIALDRARDTRRCRRRSPTDRGAFDEDDRDRQLRGGALRRDAAAVRGDAPASRGRGRGRRAGGGPPSRAEDTNSVRLGFAVKVLGGGGFPRTTPGGGSRDRTCGCRSSG
jgi:uncharacterized protein YbjT (DUF2867 family)